MSRKQRLLKSIWYPSILVHESDKPLMLINQDKLNFSHAIETVRKDREAHTPTLVDILVLLEEISEELILHKFPRIQIFKGVELLRINNLSVKGRLSVYVDVNHFKLKS